MYDSINSTNDVDRDISVIVPCFNEAKSLPGFLREISDIMTEMSELNFEILFINDGSVDDTLQILQDMKKQDHRIRYLSFSRNFGKEAAIYAGLQNARGNFVVVMDADLQDPPKLLPEMYRAVAEHGYDSAVGRRVSRKGEPLVRSFFARLFYKVIHKMSDIEIADGARDYRLMNRKFVNALLHLEEYNRFSKGLFGWVGFKNKWIEYENVERNAGETSWSFWSLFKYSIEGITAFTTVPLVFSSIVGVLLCIIAIFAVFYFILRKMLYGNPVNGWASLACIITFLGGIQLFCIGILGLYFSKMYLEIKKRPIYLIDEDSL